MRWGEEGALEDARSCSNGQMEMSLECHTNKLGLGLDPVGLTSAV